MSHYLSYCNIDFRYKTFAKTFLFKKMQTNVLQQKKMLQYHLTVMIDLLTNTI